MDCLDRTNVVQSVFARKFAHEQLHRLGVSGTPSGAPFEEFRTGDLEQTFRSVWSDHADTISI